MKTYLVAPLCFLLAIIFSSFAGPSKPGRVLTVPRELMAFHLCSKVNWCPFLGEPLEYTHFLLDTYYIVPNESDITRLIKFYYKRREFAKYQEDGWDCDDIAREFLHYSRVWSRYHYGKKPYGLTVGMAFVRLHGDVSDLFPGNHRYVTGYHVTNVILRDDGRIFFFEPQSKSLQPIESMLFEDSLTILRIEI